MKDLLKKIYKNIACGISGNYWTNEKKDNFYAYPSSGYIAVYPHLLGNEALEDRALIRDGLGEVLQPAAVVGNGDREPHQSPIGAQTALNNAR